MFTHKLERECGL